MSLHDRMINWGRAYRVGKHHRQHCYSVEWRCEGWHNPPDTAQIEWMHAKRLISDAERSILMSERPQAKPEPIDHKDAALLERAWGTLPDERAKLALKKFYVARWSRLMIARKLRENEIENYFAICEEKFANQIDFVSSLMRIGVYPLMQITEPASLQSDLRYAA